MEFCKVCNNPAIYQEMPLSEFHSTYEACLRVGLRWDYYCKQHIPKLTIGRIGGPFPNERSQESLG